MSTPSTVGLASWALFALAGTTHAQSFNIDFNAIGRAAPNAAFSAAAGVAGHWNAILSSPAPVTQSLSYLDATPSPATLTHSASHGMNTWTYGSGDFAKVMDDVAWAQGGSGRVVAELNGLDPGNYRLWVYAGLAPGQTTYLDRDGSSVAYKVFMDLEVDGVLVASDFNSGASAGGIFVSGVNYEMLSFTVPAGPHAVRVTVRGDAGLAHARAALAGMQVVRLADTLFVKPGGSGTKSGLNWANAMDNIQTAIDTAAASGGSFKQVWVAGGIYKPTTTSDRTQSFVLKNNVAVFGGFAGTEQSIAQRVLGPNPSTLSGDIGTPRVASDNSYSVVRAPNTTRTAVLDGFNIYSGNANQVITHDAGGGILGVACSATFRNLSIAYNQSLENGGGVAINSPNTLVGPIFDRCTFYQNTSVDGSGGGMFYAGVTNSGINPELVIVNCEFTRNTSRNFGGGAYIGNTWSHVSGSLFNGNTAQDGSGGGLFAGFSNPTQTTIQIRNCTITGNHAFGVGGFDTQGVHPHLYNSILWGNSGSAGSVRHQNFAFTAGGFDVDYNLIQGYQQAELLGTGNIDGNPAFVDADGPNNIAGDFDDVLALADTSPAVDAGSNALVGNDWADLDADGILNESAPFDLLMQSRRVDGPVADTGAGGAPLVDMGAFENQHPPCPMDFNGDGFLDFFDYDDFVTCYEGNGCPAGQTADYNGDAFVDFFDYDAFVTAFELGC